MFWQELPIDWYPRARHVVGGGGGWLPEDPDSIQTRTFCRPHASLLAGSLRVEPNRRVTDEDECVMVRSMSNLPS